MPRTWLQNAKRSSSIMFKGIMHPVAESCFSNRLTELVVKIFLPVTVIVFASTPKILCGVNVFLATVAFLNSLYSPPLVDLRACVMLQGSKLLIAFAMGCGALAAYLDDKDSWVPVEVFGGGALVLLFATLVLAVRQEALRLPVLKLSTEGGLDSTKPDERRAS